MGARMIDQSENALGIVAGLLEARTGQKLTADRLWRVGTALAGVLRQNGLESLEELADRLGQPNQAALAQQVVEALLNNETYFFRDRAMFDQLARDRAARAGPAARAHQAAVDLVGRLLDRAGSLFAGDAVRRAARALARLDDRDRRHRRRPRRSIAAAREGNFSQFQIQRGLGVAQMVRVLRGDAHRLARQRGAARDGPLRAAQPARPGRPSRAGST